VRLRHKLLRQLVLQVALPWPRPLRLWQWMQQWLRLRRGCPELCSA
jgi:hypothetical protein